MKTLLNAIGFLLGMLGIIALVWSIYLLFFVSVQQQLLEILPAKNFSFLATSHQYEPYKLPFFGVSVPANGAVVSYIEENNVTTFSVHPDTSTEYASSCEKTKGFIFCLEGGSKSDFYILMDSIEERLPPLSKHDVFENFKPLRSENAIDYVGTNNFLVQLLDGKMLPFLSEDHLSKVLTLYGASSEFLPYFSGTFLPSEKQKIYSFTLHKSEEKTLFPTSISKYSFLPQFFSKDTSQYLYMKQPSFLWQELKTLFSEKQWVGVNEVQTWGKENLNTLFKDQIDMDRDIIPLLYNDVILSENTSGDAMALFSLPSQELAKEFSDQFSKILKNIAGEKTPIKKGHELNDGTFLYEIFPDTTEVNEQTEEKDGNIITWFENTNPALKKVFAPGLVQKDAFVMMATDQSFLQQFWEPKHEFTDFAIPSNESIIFAYGIKGSDESGLPFSFLEIAGEETNTSFSFVGKVIEE